MATEDRNGDLHSESNGQFVSKGKRDEQKIKDAERIYNGGVRSDTIEAAKTHKQRERARKDPKFNLTFDLQSDEYKSKFKSITDDPDLAVDLHEKSCDLLSKCRGKNCEAIYLYDTKSKKWCITNPGNVASEPRYTHNTFDFIANHPNQTLLAFHNHPENLYPSYQDLNAILSNGYKKGYVLCHNGKIYEYTAPCYYIDDQEYKDLWKDLHLTHSNEAELQLDIMTQLAKKYSATIKEV